ncbi:hypothetical protein ACFL4K_03540 [Candidatus Neomarinimicrobiota bacterium]
MFTWLRRVPRTIRLWTFHYPYVDTQGLVCLRREALVAQAILASEGQPRATFRSFRRVFSNTLRDLGLSIEDRQILLAHFDSETTKIYTHPNFDLGA